MGVNVTKVLDSIWFAVAYGVALVFLGVALAVHARDAAMGGNTVAMSVCGAGTSLAMALRRRRARQRRDRERP